MDYAIHQDSGIAALSQFSAWGQHALVSEAHPTSYKDWTQAIPNKKVSSGDAAHESIAAITTVDAGTPGGIVPAVVKVASINQSAQSGARVEHVARQRSRILAARYAQGTQVTAEIEARLEILTARLELLSPRVAESQVAELERATAEIAAIAGRREDRAKKLAALLAK